MAVMPEILSSKAAVPDAAAAASPQRMLFWLWGLFWLIMILVAISDQLRSQSIQWWEPLVWEGSSCIGATAWMLWQRRAKQRYARHLDQPLRWFGYHLCWLPLLIVSFIGFVYGIRHGVYALVGDVYEHESWLFIFPYESLQLTLFAGLWLGIIFAFDSFDQWQAQRRHLLEMQRSLTEAHLAQLKAQLRPHFFFNTLNTISALMHVDVERADRMLARLGDLLRVSLQINDQEMTPLREELRTLELYAQIMQERFADRVTLTWNIAASLLDVKVPFLLLQPLLENAFKHGVERSVGSVRIQIDARPEGGNVSIAVRNNGSTLAEDWREGVGLRNCRERLKVIYGNAARLRLKNDVDAVVVEVSFPGERAA